MRNIFILFVCMAAWTVTVPRNVFAADSMAAASDAAPTTADSMTAVPLQPDSETAGTSTPNPAPAHDSSVTVEAGTDSAMPGRSGSDTAKATSSDFSRSLQVQSYEKLGGNLPKSLGGNGVCVYLVTSDIYVPSGKTVTLEPGTVLLFKNFTGLHVEGRLIAEGTDKLRIVFTSEFDSVYVPGKDLRANPYDWNGIFIHESGIGTSMSFCTIAYTVYGITSLSKYIKLDKLVFLNNGRGDLTIHEKSVTANPQPFSYALSINEAIRDGVPVKILMDPNAKKRSVLRFGGIGLAVGGLSMGAWWTVLLNRDQKRLTALSDNTVTGENSNLVANSNSDYQTTLRFRNRDLGFAIGSFALAILGGAGVGYSFSF